MSDPRHKDIEYYKSLANKQGKLVKELKVQLAQSKHKEFELLLETVLCSCEARFSSVIDTSKEAL